MRTPKEVVEFLDSRIKQTGMYKADVLKSAGYSVTLFTMSKQRNHYLKIETMLELAKKLNLSLAEILDISNDENLVELRKKADALDSLPEDIKNMIEMLLIISPESRKMIEMNIENYFKVEKQNSAKSTS